MSTYQTPEPISATVELGVGRLLITATDRTDTVVQVRPSDEQDESDVKAAAQVGVDCAGATLRVTGPKVRAFDFSRKTRSVDVSIELPTGSQLSVELQMGDVRTVGELGACRLKTSAGNVWLDRTGPLRVATSAGNVTVTDVTGDVDIHTGSGKVEVVRIGGTAVIKNSNGDTHVGVVKGALRVRAANGDIEVGSAGAGVDAKTSNGSISLEEVISGSVTLGTANGNLDIGIADGTAAWLEVNTSFGHLYNRLDNAVKPDEADERVEVRGRTSFGDITVFRAGESEK